MRFIFRLLVALLVIAVLVPIVVLVSYFAISRSNTADGGMDAIIVLGNPTKSDGTPTPEMRERVLEGVREYQAGVAPRIIMTGAAAHNQYVEAHAMAQLAESNGVPESAVIEEPQAKNTIQNIYYSEEIMQAHGWHRAEVVSSPSHLPRTALILHHFPMQWRTHDARWPKEYPLWKRWTLYWYEAVGVFRLRMKGFQQSKFLPA